VEQFFERDGKDGPFTLDTFSGTARRLASCAAPTLAQGVGKPCRTLTIKNKLSEGGGRS
jgi:hypothetical protein